MTENSVYENDHILQYRNFCLQYTVMKLKSLIEHYLARLIFKKTVDFQIENSKYEVSPISNVSVLNMSNCLPSFHAL